MKVTLNIQDDQELRSAIKDAIKGQVLNIVREEFLEIVKEELNRKLKGVGDRSFDRLLKDAMEVSIKQILRTDCGIDTWRENFIKPIVTDAINPSIVGKDWNKLVNELAKEKVKSLLDK